MLITGCSLSHFATNVTQIYAVLTQKQIDMENLNDTDKSSENTEKELRISDVSESFLTKDISREIDFFIEEKNAMIEQVMDSFNFTHHLNDIDIERIKKSLSRTWDNGFRFGLHKNSH